MEIAFFGGSFTGIEEEKQKALLEVASKFVKEGRVQGIRLSTRPDYINRYILDYLKSYGVTAIELGVQSMDDDVLIANRRGHNKEKVIESANLIKSYGSFSLGLQQMLGLYKSTPVKDVLSAVEIAELSPETVRIYPTIVLENTALYDLYKNNEYVPYTLEEAVDVGAKAYSIYESAGIKVIRMGLQATEVISEKEKGIIGPYHSSYGELVKSRIIRDDLAARLEGCKKAIIYTPHSLVSKVKGNKKCNIEFFEKNMGVSVSVVVNDNENEIVVEKLD